MKDQLTSIDINMLDNKKLTAPLFLLVVISIGRIEAFPNGAPSSACTTMSPVHGYPRFPPQVTPSPFQTEIPAGEYALMDKAVRLELRSQNEMSKFKGFLVMAFDKNNDAQPIGTFQLPSDGKLMNCTADALDAATHTFNNEKQLVTVEWIPPMNYLGTVVFRTTYVQNVSTFWVKTESIAVSFVADIPTANPSQPSVAVTQPTVANTPNSAPHPSTGSFIWAGLMAAATSLLLIPSRQIQLLA
ncbi:putative ferric-chelate reductase 1 homolog [Daphnia pulex]|uniref:putative ferric-chelate reductase 1 homolog n=1 Tax=Daphnia pulex TaxID=6669 RepID=UPI001EDEA074|nr:putative ferric-chelate reductase 1 homolog [Daphnia pulex]